jgi:transcription antitermination factor NusG
MTLNWYALQVRPRHEKSVALSLQAKDIETYLPMYRSARKWADRTKEIELPLFCGYVFCRFDPRERIALLNTTGVIQLVGVGKTPEPIDETDITNLQRLEGTELQREPHPYPIEGEEVMVCSGPLNGIVGVFVKVNRQSRLLLSVKLLHRAVSVEVDREWVAPVRPDESSFRTQMAVPLQAPLRKGITCQ